jgi:hypothetical protein
MVAAGVPQHALAVHAVPARIVRGDGQMNKMMMMMMKRH